MDRNNYSLRQRISETLNEKCYISCDCKYSCTVTIFFIQFMGNTSVVFRKSLCSVKKQFILILELPCKIVQSSKYLIMAKKNKDRYLNIFFSFGQGQCLGADRTVKLLAAQIPGSCRREIWREYHCLHCRYTYLLVSPGMWFAFSFSFQCFYEWLVSVQRIFFSKFNCFFCDDF